MSFESKKTIWEETNAAFDDKAYDERDAQIFREWLDRSHKGQSKDDVTLTPGSILKGVIIELTKDFVIVDVGLKSEGLVPVAEFSEPGEVVIGHEVEVYLDLAEDHRGQIVLSREKAERQRQWEFIVEHCSEGSIVTGRILRKVKGGLMVDIGMEAFLPGSQIDHKKVKSLDEYIGETFDFKILKINIERKNVVVSRRELLEVERHQKKMELLERAREGEIRRGVVKNITDFGAFIDLDGLDGLLHVTDMTWKRIRHPAEVVHLGQELDLLILSIDREKGRVALGLKQMEPNPWLAVEKRYPIGKIVKGVVTNLAPYGAFVELEEGVEGLIHVSEMSWHEITDPNELLTKGQEVETIVLGIQPEEGKISLGMKQLQENPWVKIEERYPVNSRIKGEVKSLNHLGVTIEIEAGVEGVVQLADLSWVKKVAHPSELLNKGDWVEAIVLSVDRDAKKINLGIKQLHENPWDHIDQHIQEGTLVEGVVSRVTAFGAFVDLKAGLEGLIHVTELSDQTVGKIEEIVAKGQHVVAKVIKIDASHKRISLSIKGCEEANKKESLH